MGIRRYIHEWQEATKLPVQYYNATRERIALAYFEEQQKLENAREEKLRFEDKHVSRETPEGMYREAVDVLIGDISRREELVERLKMEWERMKRDGLERSN